MDFVFGSLKYLVLIPVIYYIGPPIYNRTKKYLISHVMSQIKNEMDRELDEKGVSFIPINKSESALIVFNHGGKQYYSSIPYNRKKVRTMIRKRVFLIKDEEERIEITHKPGIPYQLSAKQMGGTEIIVEKDDTIIKTYNIDEIPNYLE